METPNTQPASAGQKGGLEGSPPGVYVVFCYCDYRKEVCIQQLCAFSDRDEAIAFARKYTSPTEVGRPSQYVSLCDAEYDEPFLSGEEEGEPAAKEELSIDRSMWYIRIAVSNPLKLNRVSSTQTWGEQ